jgi:hypothetical protein
MLNHDMYFTEQPHLGILQVLHSHPKSFTVPNSSEHGTGNRDSICFQFLIQSTQNSQGIVLTRVQLALMEDAKNWLEMLPGNLSNCAVSYRRLVLRMKSQQILDLEVHHKKVFFQSKRNICKYLHFKLKISQTLQGRSSDGP